MSQTSSTLRRGEGAPESLIWLSALACAAVVANLYYCQPLLDQMARSLSVSDTAVSAVPMLTQIGYALGILLFVPLGDRMRIRPLTLWLLAASVVLLTGAGMARSVTAMALFSLGIGVSCATPQILLPAVARLCRPEQRGPAVGRIMSGLLLGILLSRTVSGWVGHLLGWQAVFRLAALGMTGLGILLYLALPNTGGEAEEAYSALLGSTLRLLREEPLLQEACLTGAVLFAAFSVFWATLSYLLHSSSYHLGSETAGMFGLVGAAGAGAAQGAGRMADTLGARFQVGMGMAAILLSFFMLLAGGHSMAWLVLGVIVLDLGVQGGHVSNQTRVYSLRPGSESRLNTAYIVSYFIGGSLGTLAGTLGWERAGWTGVCVTGMGIALCGLLWTLWMAYRARQKQ